MAQLDIAIAGRTYPISCADGEEPRLRQLGTLIDAKLREGQQDPGALSEVRAMLYGALFLADELSDLRDRQTATPQETSPDRPNLDGAASALENLAERLERLAVSLENGDATS